MARTTIYTVAPHEATEARKEYFELAAAYADAARQGLEVHAIEPDGSLRQITLKRHRWIQKTDGTEVTLDEIPRKAWGFAMVEDHEGETVLRKVAIRIVSNCGEKPIQVRWHGTETGGYKIGRTYSFRQDQVLLSDEKIVGTCHLCGEISIDGKAHSWCDGQMRAWNVRRNQGRA